MHDQPDVFRHIHTGLLAHGLLYGGTRVEPMRETLRTLSLLCTLPMIAGGCSSLKGMLPSQQPLVRKTFYTGSITYTLDVDAQRYVARMISLQGNAASLQGEEDVDPSSDRLALPLYRDADLNRDHHISSAEAETAFEVYVRQFEDQLGPVVYR